MGTGVSGAPAGDILSHPLFLLFAAASLGIISTALVAASRYSRRVIRTLDKIEDNVLPHFAPPPPGVPDQSLPARVEHVAAELSTNHGKSVKDVVNAIDGTVRDHERRLLALELRRQQEHPPTP